MKRRDAPAPRRNVPELPADLWRHILDPSHAGKCPRWALAVALARVNKTIFCALAAIWKERYTLDDVQLEAMCNIVIGRGNQLIVGGGGFGKSHVANAAIDVLDTFCTVGAAAHSRLAAGNFKGRGKTLPSMLGIRPVQWPMNRPLRPDQFVLWGDGRYIEKDASSSWCRTFLVRKRDTLRREQTEADRAAALHDKYGNEVDPDLAPDGNDEKPPVPTAEQWVPVLSARACERLRALDVLFVDECMVLEEFRFTQMLAILRFYRQEPGGGMRPLRLVFLGDHCQTRPIVPKPKPIQTHRGMHAFLTPTFKRIFPLGTSAVLEFKKNHRVANEQWADFLLRLRVLKPDDTFTQKDVDMLKQLCASYTPAKSHLKLNEPPLPADKQDALVTATFAIVSHKKPDKHWPSYACLETWKRYVDLHHPKPNRRTYEADDHWHGPVTHHRTVSGTIVPRSVELFVGCPVKAYVIEQKPPEFFDVLGDDQPDDDETGIECMSSSQYYVRRREVRGVVTTMEDDCVYVRGSDPEPVCIEKIAVYKHYHDIELPDGDCAVARRVGIPIFAEPAGTMHAVQGQTKRDPHHVFVDMSWEANMIYVAASRATHPSLIHWVGDLLRLNTNRRYVDRDNVWCNNGDVVVDKRILDFQAQIDAFVQNREQARGGRAWFGV